jgi:hypothetical protein
MKVFKGEIGNMILLLRWKVLKGNGKHDSTFLMKGFKGELETWFYFLDEMFMGGICNMNF